MGKVWHTGHRQPREPFPTTNFLADILATIWPHIWVPLGKGASGKTGENPSRSWKLTTQRSEPGPLELFTGRWLLGSGRGKTRWCWWTSGSPMIVAKMMRRNFQTVVAVKSVKPYAGKEVLKVQCDVRSGEGLGIKLRHSSNRMNNQCI